MPVRSGSGRRSDLSEHNFPRAHVSLEGELTPKQPLVPDLNTVALNLKIRLYELWASLSGARCPTVIIAILPFDCFVGPVGR